MINSKKKHLTIEQHGRVVPLLLRIQEDIAIARLSTELQQAETAAWLVTQAIQANYLRMAAATNALHHELDQEGTTVGKNLSDPEDSSAAHHSYLPPCSRPYGPSLRDWPLHSYDMGLPCVNSEPLSNNPHTET